jgi:hypothetical protein
METQSFWYYGKSGKKYEIQIPRELAASLRNTTAWKIVGKYGEGLCSQRGPQGDFICSGVEDHRGPHIACTHSYAVACFQ